MTIGKIYLKNGFFLLLSLFILFGESNFLPLIFLAALVHEVGHIFAIWGFGGSLQRVEIGFFGGKIDYTMKGEGYLAKMVILLAGSAFNLLAAFLFAQLGTRGEPFLFFAGANLLLALFNLLPILPLDGGRALLCLMSKCFNPLKGQVIVETIGKGFTYCLFALGIWVFYQTAWNISLLLFSVFLLCFPFLEKRKCSGKKFRNFHKQHSK